MRGARTRSRRATLLSLGFLGMRSLAEALKWCRRRDPLLFNDSVQPLPFGCQSTRQTGIEVIAPLGVVSRGVRRTYPEMLQAAWRSTA